MHGAGAEAADGLPVQLGGVPLVRAEIVAGKPFIALDHQRVPGCFGQNRSRRDGMAAAVPLDHGFLRQIEQPDIPSIDQQGNIPIQRVVGDNIDLCETLNLD